jgi:hypothetical protein
MSRVKILTSETQAQELVDSYIANNPDTPTISGLILHLGFRSLDTLWKYMDKEDDIGDILTSAYLYIVNKHESKLFDKACVGSIFWLKSIRKCGFTFNKTEDTVNPHNVDNRLLIEVVSDKTPIK